jgi:hypothetical protein
MLLTDFSGRASAGAEPSYLNNPWSMLARFMQWNLVGSVFEGFGLLFYLLLLYIIFRRQWLAILVMLGTLFFVDAAAFPLSGPPLLLIASILSALTIVIAVARFGLLAGIVARLFYSLYGMSPLTTDFSVWYATSTVFVIVVSLALVIYGFYISLGSQSVFSDRLLRDV